MLFIMYCNVVRYQDVDDTCQVLFISNELPGSPSHA